MCEDAVHVGTDKIGVFGYVDAGIGCVGFCSSVGLVHYYELVVLGVGALEQAFVGLGLYLFNVVVGYFYKFEVLDENFLYDNKTLR